MFARKTGFCWAFCLVSSTDDGSIPSSSSNTKLEREINSGRSCVGFQRLEASPSFSNFERSSLSAPWAHQPHVQWNCFCTQRLFVNLKPCWTRHSNACWCQMPTISIFLMWSAWRVSERKTVFCYAFCRLSLHRSLENLGRPAHVNWSRHE